MKYWMLKLWAELILAVKKCFDMSVVVCLFVCLFLCSPPMSGEFAASEWRVAVLSVGSRSTYVVSAVLHALHSFPHLPYMIFRSGGVPAPLLFCQVIMCISIHKVYKVHPTPRYTCWDLLGRRYSFRP